MQQNAPRIPIHEYISNSGVQLQLYSRLREAQQRLVASITQAATITQTSDGQLRYWESLGLFSPERPSSGERTGQRRYSQREFARLFIISELQRQSYTLTEIVVFFQEAHAFIEALVEGMLTYGESSIGHSRSIVQRVNQAEEALFWRIFVPRVMYLSLCLLFEEIASGNVGLFLPLHPSVVATKQGVIQLVEDLEQLGHVLIGWHSYHHPFCTFLTHGPVLETTSQYRVLAPQWPSECHAIPHHAYVVVRERFAHLLERTSVTARQVAGRLLHLLQMTTEKWMPALQAGGDFMALRSPEFRDVRSGDHFLNELAERVVEIGGKDETGRERWRFCCILFPKEGGPLRQRSLLVQAQSSKSPHRIRYTDVSPDQRSISIKAYQAGHSVYLPSAGDQELELAYQQVEQVGSAIAVPIERKSGSPIGVLYVAADLPDAFSQDDQALLRVMGRLIAEHQSTSHSHTALIDRLAGVIVSPLVLDSRFQEFCLEDRFVRDLEGHLRMVQSPAGEERQIPSFSAPSHKKSIQHLSLLAVDIENLDNFDDETARDVLKEVGRRIQQWLEQDRDTPGEMRLYYMYANQFYLLLKDIALEDAKAYAMQLHQTLRTHGYSSDISSSGEQEDEESSGKNSSSSSRVSISMAVNSYPAERLQAIVQRYAKVANARVQLLRSLEQTLNFGKDAGGGAVAVWERECGTFALLGNREKK